MDPIADSARAILDGHIVLIVHAVDRHYPAIDIEQSISRAMVNLIDTPHLDQIRKFKVLFARYQRSLTWGLGWRLCAPSDPVLDQAIALYPCTESFLHAKADFFNW